LREASLEKTRDTQYDIPNMRMNYEC
jgi:hypothetical protein